MRSKRRRDCSRQIVLTLRDFFQWLVCYRKKHTFTVCVFACILLFLGVCVRFSRNKLKTHTASEQAMAGRARERGSQRAAR